VGILDERAFEALMASDPDEALSLLADLAGATDARLRALARALAGRVVLDLAARSGPARRGPLGRLVTRRLPETGGDLDLDASLDPLVEGRAGGRPPRVDDLRGRVWDRPTTALCLLVDRSGSMGGARLATAAVAAAAVSTRAPTDFSVVAFAEEALVVKAQDRHRPPDEVVDDLLTLRGFGTTDLARALRVARLQLERSTAGRRLAIVLSDCRATAGEDPLAEASALAANATVAVIAPADDDRDARALADAIGATHATVAGPASVPEAFAAAVAR